MSSLLHFRLLCLLICLIVLADVYATEKADLNSFSWQEFDSKEGHFSIRFPSAPVVRVTHQDSVIGSVTNHIFESKTNQARFTVDYSDLPDFAVTFTGSDTIYNHASGALLKKTLGKLVSSKDFQYQGHSGRYLIYDIPPIPEKPTMYGEAYLFLLDKRLYVINATAAAGTSKTKIHHFLNSLRFE